MTQSSELLALADDAQEAAWFCDRGGFWGTINQLCLCARCGGTDRKRADEPRHFGGIFTPRLHFICDECFATLATKDERDEG